MNTQVGIINTEIGLAVVEYDDARHLLIARYIDNDMSETIAVSSSYLADIDDARDCASRIYACRVWDYNEI